MNRCPVRDCSNHHRDGQVMCSRCWYAVSPGTRRQVWREFRRGRGSKAHRQAVFTAIKEARAAMQQRIITQAAGEVS